MEATERLNVFPQPKAAELSSGHNLGTIAVVSSKPASAASVK